MVRIEVPFLPPVEYSPNSRLYWTEKHRAGKVYHDAVFYCCVDARNRGYREGQSFPLVRAKLNLTVVFAELRLRDEDNLLTRFKPGLDAVVDSGILLDDDVEHLEIGEVEVVVDPERAPLTIIELDEIKKLEGGHE
ncbi:unnamed protein product [marine sediment metagenome]|uniref:Uncharacterized protein n=1 Tax=marine sediment metagenome TaxID=412755 RepID=X1QA09_9ZZZZ